MRSVNETGMVLSFSLSWWNKHRRMAMVMACVVSISIPWHIVEHTPFTFNKGTIRTGNRDYPTTYTENGFVIESSPGVSASLVHENISNRDKQQKRYAFPRRAGFSSLLDTRRWKTHSQRQQHSLSKKLPPSNNNKPNNSRQQRRRH